MSSETPEEIAREAKRIHQGLKELVKKQNPWDKEVEFNRKNLRRLYLRLLLLEPYAKESKDAETHLWMQTSYPFISHYKQEIASLDRALQQQQQQRTHSRQNNHSNQQHDHRQHGPVEYRKLMQRFRQFLAEEEKFWIAFVTRYYRQFGISEAQPALLALGVVPATMSVRIPELGDGGDGGSATTNTAVHTNDGSPNNTPRPQRDHFGFPPEDTSVPSLPPGLGKEEQHTARLAILAKAFVCLGDIARYRELYNEAGGRPRAGQEDGPGVMPARRGRNRRSGASGFEQVARARTYHRSISFYEHARALLPSDGNAAHQLAILSFYGGDVFDALYWYLRALCVKGPYEAAVENLRKVFGRAISEGAARWAREGTNRGEEREEVPAKVKVDRMKDNIVLLHALLRVGAERLNVSPDVISSDIAQSFQAFVSDRVLPIDTVTRVVVLAQGALWNHRMIRDNSKASSSHQKSRERPPRSKSASRTRVEQDTNDNPDTPIIVESRLLGHLITLHRVLLEVGTTQLATPPPSDASDNDLAPRITAAFRRILPALRVASKWMVANVGYIIKVASSSSEHDGRNTEGGSPLRDGMSLFYNRFAEFYTALGKVFPIERLPRLEASLDEDVDLKGFLPLRGRMLGDNGQHATADSTGEISGDRSSSRQNGHAAVVEKVHPNEEQLMRIWDLLMDAKGLAEIEGFPVVCGEGSTFMFDDAKYMAKAENGQPTTVPVTNSNLSPNLPEDRGREWMHGRHQEQFRHSHPIVTSDQELDDDAMTDTGRTDDDPVEDAFRQVLNNHDSSENDGAEEDGDEDEIVWNPRPLASSSKMAVSTTTMTAHTVASTVSSPPMLSEMESPDVISRPVLSPPNRTASLSKPKSPPAVPGTTAQDLLNNVMGFSQSKARLKSGSGPGLGMLSPRLSSGAISSQPPSLLFGGSQNAPVSIWSTSFDQDPTPHHYHTPSQPAVNAMSMDIENGVGRMGQSQTHAHMHSHSLSMIPPSVGLTSAWPPLAGALRNGSANGRAPQRPLGMKDGTAEPTSSPHAYQSALHDDPFMRPISHSPVFPQSLQALRGPAPSHQRSFSLSVSGLPQVHQSAAIPSHGTSGFPGVSTSGAVAGPGLLPGGTMHPGGFSSSITSAGSLGAPGHSGLSSFPTTIARGSVPADPAIAFATGPLMTSMPISSASTSHMGSSQVESFSTGSNSGHQQYVRPGHYPSRSMSSRVWGANA